MVTNGSMVPAACAVNDCVDTRLHLFRRSDGSRAEAPQIRVESHLAQRAA